VLAGAYAGTDVAAGIGVHPGEGRA